MRDRAPIRRNKGGQTMLAKKTVKKTKNVLIISASFRSNSNSRAICKEVVKGMRAAFDLSRRI